MAERPELRHRRAPASFIPPPQPVSAESTLLTIELISWPIVS